MWRRIAALFLWMGLAAMPAAAGEAVAIELVLLVDAPRQGFGPNAIGPALAAGHALILGNGIDGTRRVIDFSGDSSWAGGGIPVALARQAALDAGSVIDGLAILCRHCESGRPTPTAKAPSPRPSSAGRAASWSPPTAVPASLIPSLADNDP